MKLLLTLLIVFSSSMTLANEIDFASELDSISNGLNPLICFDDFEGPRYALPASYSEKGADCSVESSVNRGATNGLAVGYLQLNEKKIRSILAR